MITHDGMGLMNNKTRQLYFENAIQYNVIYLNNLSEIIYEKYLAAHG